MPTKDKCLLLFLSSHAEEGVLEKWKDRGRVKIEDTSFVVAHTSKLNVLSTLRI